MTLMLWKQFEIIATRSNNDIRIFWELYARKNRLFGGHEAVSMEDKRLLGLVV